MKIGKSKNGHYYWTDYINGRRVKRESVEWKLKRHAQENYDDYIRNKVEPLKRITFEKVADEFLEFKALSCKQSSIQSFRYIIKSRAQSLLNKQIKSITHKDLINWQTELIESDYNNKYLTKIQGVIFRVFKYALTNGYIKSNPALKLVTAAKHEPPVIKIHRIVQPDEFNRFISVVDDPVHYAFFTVLYWSGCRIGELLALNIEDYQDHKLIISKNYDNKNRLITTTKTGISRVVDLPEQAVRAMDQLLEYYSQFEYSPESPYFALGQRFPYSSIKRWKNNYCVMADVETFKFHDLRHSHVSLLINLGFSAFDIAKRLGHSVEMVNNTYGHLFPSVQKSMVNKLNEYQNEYQNHKKVRPTL